MRRFISLLMLVVLCVGFFAFAAPTAASGDTVCYLFEVVLRNDTPFIEGAVVDIEDVNTDVVYAGPHFIILNPGETGTLELHGLAPKDAEVFPGGGPGFLTIVSFTHFLDLND